MSKAILNRLVAYYRSCYQLDTGALHVSHAFAKTGGLHTFVDSLDLFQREGTLFPLPTEVGQAFEESLNKDGQEKALVGWLWPLAAPGRSPYGKYLELFAPVVLYEASLVVDEGIYYAELELHLPQPNPAFTDWFSEKSSLDASELASVLSPARWTDVAIEHFSAELNKSEVLQVDLKDHHESLDTSVEEHEKGASKILPHGGFSIIPRVKGSLGVLHELSLLADKKITSKPLSVLLTGEHYQIKAVAETTEPILVKGSLSDNQKRIVFSSDVNTLTRVVGPPGTGKSFTTAAIASHAYARGQRVLVVSRNQEAVEVVADKIENELEMKNLVVRAARPTSRTHLRNRMKRILNKIGIAQIDTKDFRLKKSLLSGQLKNIRKFEKSLTKRQRSIYNRSQRMFSARGKWHESILRSAYSIISAKKESLNELTALMIDEERQFQYIVSESQHQTYNARILRLLNSNFHSLKAFAKGLTEKKGVARDKSFAEANFDVILDALPIWTVTTADLHKVLPLEKEMFDLVIIDEASQTDIASSIPALYRAKRVVIIGDPFQLRHISFVSGEQQNELKKRFQLDDIPSDPLNYRDVSILDLAEMRTQSGLEVHMLDEHFRSQPEIIQFSNETYYAGSLKIMTRGIVEPATPPLRATRVKGLQDKSGVNTKEANFILSELKRLIALMRHRGSMKTIGILTPFRAQAKYLEGKVKKLIHIREIHDCKIFVGTPFHFQGEERDIMLLSLVLSDESHSAAFRYLEKPGVFNVAITRARDIQKVYHSFDPNGKYQDNIASKYLRQIGEDIETVSTADISTSTQFFDDLLQRLREIPDLVFDQDVIIAGQRLDLLLSYQDRQTAIDLVGIVGPRGESLPIHAVRSLSRIGISVLYLDAFDGVEACIAELQMAISKKD
ncbi:MAG: DEAD/DEAH box helicase [Saprospiraceae bacterium]